MEKPALPKGTRDFGPLEMAKRQFIFNTIRTTFQKFGFLPLETPAMENLTTLTGKYGDEGDQLLFRILNSGDFLKDAPKQPLQDRNSKALSSFISEKGLRYDLTVPFARYVVMNRNEITFPFKRYQIQPVWRADKPQKGRYREFYQCDADVVGTNSLVCEAEIILMIKEVFAGLGIQDYTIKLNHRGVLSGLAEITGNAEKESALFVAIDKLDKIGEQNVREELKSKGFAKESLDLLFGVLLTSGTPGEKIAYLRSRFGSSTSGLRGLADIEEMLRILNGYGKGSDHVELDLSLARGLSYYTGCIFEVKVNNVAIGSVSGGGRYDRLTSAFGDKSNLSGVGFSFGVDRIYDAMEELQLFPGAATIATRVVICHFDADTFYHGLGVLAKLRDSGVSAEIYPDLQKLKKQLDYANKKGIPFCIVIGPEEMQNGMLALKNMNTGEQRNIALNELAQAVGGVAKG